MKFARPLRDYHSAGVRHVVALRGDPPTGFDAPYETAARGLPVDGRTGRGRQRQIGLSKSQSEPIRSGIRKARRSCMTSRSSSRRSTPGRRARSPSSFSTIRSIFVFSTSPRPPASTFRSCLASFRCRISGRPPISPAEQGRACRNGSPDRFDGLENDAATRRLVAAAVCAEQVIDLIDHGVKELHFYTMNRADLVFAICHLVGLRAKPGLAAIPLPEQGPPALAAGAL